MSTATVQPPTAAATAFASGSGSASASASPSPSPGPLQHPQPHPHPHSQHLSSSSRQQQQQQQLARAPSPHRNYSTRTNDSSSRPHGARGQRRSPNTPTSPTGLNFPSVHLGSFDSLATSPLHSSPPDNTPVAGAGAGGTFEATADGGPRPSSSTGIAHRRYASKDSVRSAASKKSLTAPPFANNILAAGGPVQGSVSAPQHTSSSSTTTTSSPTDAPRLPSASRRDTTVDPQQTESPTELDAPEPAYKGADVTVTPSSPDQTHAPAGAGAAQAGGATASSSSSLTSPTAPSPKHAQRVRDSPPLLSPLSLDGPSLATFRSTSPFTFDDPKELENRTTPQPLSNAARPISWAPGAQGAASAISQFGVRSDARAPSPLLTPTSSTFDLASPRLRESPSVPRRRTIIQASHAAKRASGIHPARESVPPPPEQSQHQEQQTPAPASIEGESPSSPSPNPRRITSVSSLGASSKGTRPRLQLAFPEPLVTSEAGTSTAVDSRSPQDTSPTKKRTLPRPPKSSKDSHNPSPSAQPLSSETISMPTPMPVAVAAAPTITSPTFTVQTSPKANISALGIIAGEPMAMHAPQQGAQTSTRPPPPQQRSSRASLDPRASLATSADTQQALQTQQQQDKSRSVPTPIPVRHRPTKSASNFPNIPGLADAGPYPTQMRSPNGLGLPALPALPGAGPMANGIPLPPGIKPGEEICLECMMRDRDLADVDVTGDGVWERASDVALEELKAREYDVLRGMSIDHSISTLSMDDSISSSTHAETASSPRSHASGLPSDEASRAATLKKQQAREARRVRREERDAQVARIGWRGFKWEEGTGGEGFPRGFRGTRPGALTEKGIKNVLTMYPSSSALRYQILQSYLRNQYRLIIEIRQEAHRHGHYAEPEELTYPQSPTLSSHDSQPSSGGLRGAPSIKAPSISTARSAPVTMQLPSAPRLRESPSTPAGLNTGIQARPRTQYLGEHDPMSRLSTATNIRQPLHVSTTSPPNRQSHFKNPSTSVGTKGRESKFFAGDDWSDTEDLWPGYDDLGSPGSGHLRPFSFAVRAGQQREGSIGSHHRRSFFGKFGDSVTSFFTGSQGGSGSMMDMHLGIDMDRRNRTSSYQAHESPRVSAYVPVRPAFSTRQSSYTAQPQMDEMPASSQDRPRARSVAVPQAHQPPRQRPTPVSMYATEEEVSSKKKNGIKGLLQKMKGKKGRRASMSAAKAEEMGISQTPPPPAELEPPPPMNFLVNRNDRNHDRKRSSSSFSIPNDSQPSLPPGSPAHMSQRSVSAPMGSSGSDISPTSSRFLAERPSEIPRRSTAPVELPPGAAESGFHLRKTSQPSPGMEMLSGTPPGGMPQAIPAFDNGPMYSEEPQPMGPGDSVVGPPGATAPNSYYRQSQPSLSSRLSGSSTTVPAIETPEPMNGAMYLAPNSQGNTSPNRYKNLPPLPPGMVAAMPSPDQFSDADSMRQMSMYEKAASRMSTASSFPRTSVISDSPTVHRTGVPPSAKYFPTASPRYQQQPQLGSPPHMTVPMPTSSASSPGGMPSTPFLQPNNGGFVPQHRVIQPRASFDALGDRHNQRVRRSTAAPEMLGMPADMGRNAQSMYINQSAAASTGSFGRFLKGGGADGGHIPPPYVTNVTNTVPVTEDKKERRRGIKSFFGKK